MKRWLVGYSIILALAMPITAQADMQPKEISEAFLFNGEWKDTKGTTWYQDGLPDGWHEENGDAFYIKNKYAVSSLQLIDGQEYLFTEDGRLLLSGTEEYTQYIDVLNRMHEAKAVLNADWSHDMSGKTEHEKLKLLDVYAKKYMLGCSDIGQTGFYYDGDMLKVDVNHPDIRLESQISEFCEKFGDLENVSEEGKIRKIHDVIVDTFSYDSSLKNRSGSFKEAFSNGNRIVCGGYAEIFRQVCFHYGIEAEVINGTTSGGDHAWNRVMVDGAWKYVDCCWDDTYDSHTYFLKSKSFFDLTHTEF